MFSFGSEKGMISTLPAGNYAVKQPTYTRFSLSINQMVSITGNLALIYLMLIRYHKAC